MNSEHTNNIKTALHYCTVFMDPGHFRPIFILIRNFTSYKMKSKYSQSDG